MYYINRDNLKILPFLLANFRSFKLNLIDIELTHRCNLNCEMCWLHGAEGTGDGYAGSELSTGEISKLLDRVAEYGPKIYLGGSEPLIRKDFWLILRKIKELGLYVFFTSNGTLLDSIKNREIVNLGVDYISFSIDGDEELHDQIRGNGVFKKVTSNIKEIMEYKKEKQSPKPIISVNIRMTPFIIGRLDKTIDAIDRATDESVDSYRLHQLWYITKRELERHQLSVKKYLNCFAPKAACHINTMAGNINSKILYEEISRLKNNQKIELFPNMGFQEMNQYYMEGFFSKRRCWAPFYRIVIKPNGDVTYCPDEWINDYIIGNIRDEDFYDIWNNKKARYFRSILFWHKSFPGCKRCSWMYAG